MITDEITQLRTALRRLLGCFKPYCSRSKRWGVCLNPAQFGGAPIPDYDEYRALCQLADGAETLAGVEIAVEA